MLYIIVLQVAAKTEQNYHIITSIRVDNVKHIYNLYFIINNIYIKHKYN